MAWTKISDDRWVSTNHKGAKSWTKLSKDIWVSDTGKTVTKIGDFVITNGEAEEDVDFPEEF